MEVYFDNSATTKPYDEVIETMVDAMKNYYGNPSSAYSLGIKAEQKINECRDIIASTINCNRNEIIFTSGGSESNNFLIRGFLSEGKHMITTKIEHPSVLNTCKALEKIGVKVTYLDVDENGKIDINELLESINKETVIVSIMHTNNETGVMQDIETIGKLIKEKSSRVKFHVDAVQAYGKYKIDVKKCNIDLLSVSGHKIHGPRGIGFAYLKKELRPRPLIYGGGQENGFRSGTENLAAIAGFSEAAKIAYSRYKDNLHKVSEIKNYFIEGLKSIQDIKINSQGDSYSPYVLSVSFLGVKGEVLLHMLEDKGIFVSTGSACSAKNNDESHVLKSIGLKNEDIRGTIRFSFSEFNKKEEVDYTIEVIDKSLKFLRRIKI
ncbi:cysteine desulfurase [Clostridium algifaecis]|uniref:Cysteine desulfurase n=1 Tax=Clostridium algifaecis TaxID=1472040 RepID=A0ABS4KUC6_9CLOT|nr:cysteine desulfurase family protein [Clostridium algifaecis]MBP2033633.1 cysteine desulfurase [Clostridium algifaecis]